MLDGWKVEEGGHQLGVVIYGVDDLYRHITNLLTAYEINVDVW